jgi:hypothetical protein
MWGQQFSHLGEFAGIVSRDHELAGNAAMLGHRIYITP